MCVHTSLTIQWYISQSKLSEPKRKAGPVRRAITFVIGVLIVAVSGTACLIVPGDTSQITLVSSSTANGWRYDFYRNLAYPCSISGYQTFVVGTKVSSSPTASSPLWVWMHGGGVGYFDSTGKPRPDASQMTENSATSLQATLTNAGLSANIQADSAGFRMLAVSYCNRDIYSGTLQTDPNNLNKNADGSAKTTNGLQATKAAVAYTEAKYPTTKYFLAGGSAGSAGAYYVGWSEQLSGNAPAGVVGDASVVNVEEGTAAYQQGVCQNGNFDPSAQPIITQRVDPQVASVNDEVDKLVTTGQLMVPLLHIWNHADTNTCGSTPMQCPLRDGSVVTMGATDCDHQPLAAAISAEGSGSKSENLPLCVALSGTPSCSLHVVTTHAGLTNSDPASPPNYLTAILEWVNLRLADP
jgi:hypothetical protein